MRALLVHLAGERARFVLGQSVHAPAKPSLKVSREGVVLIKSFEGFRPQAVRDEEGRWVIGYGHTASAREGLTVGEQDAELLLQYDLMPVVRTLNERIHAPLNQHQFDALASFAVSVGLERFLASDVLQRVNAGQAGEAADALIGWPETTPDVQLRRRAAERALFVADPASPVLLADLLSAPLPPPPIRLEAPIAPPVADPAGARAAAVATLLGETLPPLNPTNPEPEPTVEAPPPVEPRIAPRVGVPANGFSPLLAVVRPQTFGLAPLAAAATPAPTLTIEPDPEPLTPAPDTPPEPEPAPSIEAAAPPRAPQPEPEPVIPFAPVAPLVPPAPGPSPFPPLDEPLVLTPATEADFVEAERPAWPEEDRTPVAVLVETELFGDEPTLPVMRHEIEPAPRRFDWSYTGAFLIMGFVGLAACTASAAAFRLAVAEPSDMGETTVIAWALALIGAICVGVSSWNLYVRWGRTA